MVRVCPDYVPYHMVYKFGCWQGGDKEFNDNEDVELDKESYREYDYGRDIPAGDPDLQNNNDNINIGPGSPAEEVLSERYTESIFWHDDPSVLFQRDKLLNYLPNENMDVNESLNSIVRFSIYLFVVAYFYSWNSNLVLIPIIALIGTLYIKLYKEDVYIQRMNCKTRKPIQHVNMPPPLPMQQPEPKQNNNIRLPGMVGEKKYDKMDEIIKNSQQMQKQYVTVQSEPPKDYDSYKKMKDMISPPPKENFATADNKSDDYPQQLFKSLEEAVGDEIQKRNTVKTVIDPVCLIKGGPQAAIYGKNVQRRIYW